MLNLQTSRLTTGYMLSNLLN